MASIVRTEHLTKDFPAGFWRSRPHRALDDVSMEVGAGGVFGLLGPNGAGKSTTLKLLVGLLRPTTGFARVFDRSPNDPKSRERLGFLPENPAFYDELSAEELLAYFAGLCGYGAFERHERARRALDLVGLSEDRHRRLRQYSKGMVQRVGIAQALINDPELVILDEPMSGLDPVGRHDVRQIILQLRDEGRTVVFSSHILPDAELLCTRVGILAKGRVVASGSLSDLTAGAARGWEIVVDGLTDDAAARLGGRVRRTTRISDRRFSLELPAETRPEALVADLAGSGASLVSVTPLRATLEEFFLQVSK
ncbi:MAG TPA: ABC transporter ATP-binding protein [Vicinamibacterales bacterium]|nr:ABC transporter ATP-binding protein [Vicinamibacterales bacterium]